MCNYGNGGGNGNNGGDSGHCECSRGPRDVLVIPFYHRERIALVTWDFRFQVARVSDTAFADPLLSGDTTIDVENFLYRVDSRGLPGTIVPLTAAGVATERTKTCITAGYVSGILIVPLGEEQLAAVEHGKSYIVRMQQKARGHDEWSASHDVVITL